MCEFKVSVSDSVKSSVVATDVVYAEQVEGKVVLRDILGVSSVVDSAIISYVNVNSQQMKLLSLPIFTSFIKFIELYNKCAADGECDPEFESAWNKLKLEGNQLIEDLKSK
ncbi:MAG: CooT family nickel-binding protein [Candidatus Freyarchaeum deiterrae]